ncbi:hypothetical protein GGX14DRAFT_637094 [Mycena pura]|uniref:DUF6533 domain-containing protein n=1 Tax=Mycena pura TaxID=153505 RepID=A0AAD6VH20_9AGAR|nr:hypothetical protein GGX14DRAFT_637094 [Mycena pura]
MAAGAPQFDLLTTTAEIRVHDYLFLPAITFLFWDHLITFGDEVRFLWKRTRTPSTYCFLLNRYLAFFGYITIAVFTFTVPDSVRETFIYIPFTCSDMCLPVVGYPISFHSIERSCSVSRCKRVNVFRQILLIMNQTIICVLLTLRIYALYGRASRLWMYMLGMAACLFVLSIWSISGYEGVPVPGVEGCHVANPQLTGIHLAIPWEALFVYDLLIVGALLYKSAQTRRELGARDTLLGVCIRDGSVYFVAMALTNFANIMTLYFASPLLRGCLSTLAACLSVTMMSRLMLNLHTAECHGIFSTTAHLHASTLSAGGAAEDADAYADDRVVLDTLWTRDMERSACVLSRDCPGVDV